MSRVGPGGGAGIASSTEGREYGLSREIFVSYAHVDDEPSGIATRGMVTTFVMELEKLLNEKLGVRKDRCWMDHQLAANDRVDETLEMHVRGSRCLLLFMSRGYLASPWCQSEINNFLATNAGTFNRENVFVVAIDETERGEWPTRVQALTPVELFEKDNKGGMRRLGWPRQPTDPHSPYWQRMNELANMLREQLLMAAPPGQAAPIRAPAGNGPVSEKLPAAVRTATGGPKVWIAQPTPDLYDEWDSLARAVRQAGATVLPAGAGVYLESDEAAFIRAAVNDLTSADMLIQLLGQDAGVAIGSGALDRLALLQHELARAARSSVFAQLLRWRSAAAVLRLGDDDHDPYGQLLLGAVACPFEQFRSQVVSDIELRMNPPALPPSLSDSKGTLTVCVTAHERDRDLAANVCAVVKDLGAVPIDIGPRPSEGQTQSEYSQDFTELLNNVNGVILVRGQGSASWLHARHVQVRKVFAQRRLPVWGAFLDGPPPAKKEDVSCEGPGLLTLSCRSGVTPSPIERFLRQLTSA